MKEKNMIGIKISIKVIIQTKISHHIASEYSASLRQNPLVSLFHLFIPFFKPSLRHAYLFSFALIHLYWSLSHSLNIEPMKQQIGLLFFVLLLSSFLASARLLEPLKGPRQGEKEVEINENAFPQSSHELKDDMEELMGSEECYMKDEECISRRMMVEAHLDYIYTQHHKP
ncbi:hypothetical protein JHK82_027123 [Glycine max]|uniref:Phytosulfokine n=3 Tax=Glycine subgen. Soja TaxID=1462606 RepID=K7LHS9_SOYBN|nr:hypothetical protein JHK85_027750 [Glycine max]KAG5003110.1 hypothetical protein JHK86_027249 [Glycine max]KAG5126288.1 hypothetical protein JHK82_027123 [Glycine max]KAG5150888.1 hypothetical protein JHK84_027360 [Glycine max]KAH1137101.1 hypothetical protein GYH30_027187 [Glycine max]